MTVKITKSDLLNKAVYINGKKEWKNEGTQEVLSFFDAGQKYGEKIESIEIKQKSIHIITR